MEVPGTSFKMKLERPQIDKVAKDKTSKYADNFTVTLVLMRPDDQIRAGPGLTSSPRLARHSRHRKAGSKSSPESSSEEDTTDSDGNFFQGEHVAVNKTVSTGGETIIQSGWV